MHVVFAGKHLDTQVLAKVIVSAELVLLPKSIKGKMPFFQIFQMRLSKRLYFYSCNYEVMFAYKRQHQS